MPAHNLLYLLIALLIVGAMCPYFTRVEYPGYAAPSIWSLVVLLIVLRFIGII